MATAPLKLRLMGTTRSILFLKLNEVVPFWGMSIGILVGASLKRAGGVNAYVYNQQSVRALLLFYEDLRAIVLVANSEDLYQLGFHG